ncbi:aminotransferase class III-fold pyridoxal phosphate-dependent enzyme [Amylibacter sp.]|nr:aminotransferase class III-fold pyridoxal phosphate-dependent enzyme [Amylibacter sp.]
MKIVAIIQARMGSTRLPGKVLKRLAGKTVIEVLLTRLGRSELIDEICVATSSSSKDDILCAEVKRLGYVFVRGSETDVLGRFWCATSSTSADIIVRITGDCPVIDPSLVDKAIELFLNSNVDYVSNIDPPTFPDGLDVEVFTKDALAAAQLGAVSNFDREHVTPFIRNGNFTKKNLQAVQDFSNLRLTLDEMEDLDLLLDIYEYFAPDIHFTFDDIIKYLLENNDKIKINNIYKRNEGANMRSGQKLWNRAKKIIPGGNMLLSKQSEMHLPNNWPSYFSKTSGCSVWDLDGKHYYDYYLMGVGTNILGYSHPEVDRAVMQVIKDGNMSSLNAPEEVALAEKLIELDPWAGMVRFARSGGEANAISIRIARAASGRDGVAVCGYHGWHDWYLSANLSDDDKLADHLLPGLGTAGVPRSLKGNVHPFNYNDFAHIAQLVSDKAIGVIKMEVTRNVEPQDNFLQRVRKLATDNNIVLIFDECTSGFRECFGGLHKNYGVYPDIAVYGKTLGNGYAVTAVVGREEIMQSAQSTFISSTFWTERLGSAAALKTLEVMESEKPWEKAREVGLHISQIWQNIAEEHCLKIEISGLPALSRYTIISENALAYKTLITQEFLKHGYLAGTILYASNAHDISEFEEYAEILNEVFSLISDCENGRDVSHLLDGPICNTGFKRLN